MDLNKTEDPELRIMLVEDSKHDAITFRRAFKESNISCTITVFYRAEEALEGLQPDESSYDIVVSDHGLPDMLGLEFCKILLTRKTNLPLVLMTGIGTEKIAVEALKAGVYDYIIKDDYAGHLELLPLTITGVVNKHKEKQLRIKAEEQIKASLKEKEVLLREIHHRVKNNMQVVSSLLKIQAGKTKDKEIIEALEESQNRIKSMALIHESLYRSKDIANINFSEYIRNLVNALYRSYKINTSKIVLKMDMSDVSIDIDSAIPCGLIINELITNSLKYAFHDDKNGEIKISLSKTENSEIMLEVSDNGIGISANIDYRNAKTLGLRLIVNLTEHQLDGKVELNRSKGTKYRIRFKEVKYKKRI